jgi:hypothetical protein
MLKKDWQAGRLKTPCSSTTENEKEDEKKYFLHINVPI